MVLARHNGSSWEELGLARRAAGHGLRTGGPLALAIAGGMLVGAILPLTRPLFNDERVAAGAGAPELVYQTTFRIPVGTVAFEELAFRGVLLDLLRKQLPPGAVVAVNSVTFGLWHILPTLAMAKANIAITGRSDGPIGCGRTIPRRSAPPLSPRLHPLEDNPRRPIFTRVMAPEERWPALAERVGSHGQSFSGSPHTPYIPRSLGATAIRARQEWPPVPAWVASSFRQTPRLHPGARAD